MPKLHLTERAIKELPTPTSRVDYWDSELAGFCLRSLPTGRKAWVVRYRDKTRTWCFLSGGTWPTVKTEEARRWARTVLSRAALGLPVVEATTSLEPSKPTLATLWGEYEQRGKGRERNNRASLGRVHILPVLGDRPLEAIKSRDIDQLMQAELGRPRTANNIKTMLHGAFELARVLNLIPEDKANPASFVKSLPLKPRHRHLSDDEIARLGATLFEMRQNREFYLLHAELITLLLLTGARYGELANAKWSMLDTTYPAIILDSHKTASTRPVKRVELGREAFGLLQSLPHKNEAIFYGKAGNGHVTTIYKAWQRVLNRSKIVHATIHDLRRTFATVARNDGMSMDDVGVLLGHKELSVTGIYAIPQIEFRQRLIAKAEASMLSRLKVK